MVGMVPGWGGGRWEWSLDGFFGEVIWPNIGIIVALHTKWWPHLCRSSWVLCLLTSGWGYHLVNHLDGTAVHTYLWSPITFLFFGSIMRIYNIFSHCNEKVSQKYQIKRKRRSVVLEFIPRLHYACKLYNKHIRRRNRRSGTARPSRHAFWPLLSYKILTLMSLKVNHI